MKLLERMNFLFIVVLILFLFLTFFLDSFFIITFCLKIFLIEFGEFNYFKSLFSFENLLKKLYLNNFVFSIVFFVLTFLLSSFSLFKTCFILEVFLIIIDCLLTYPLKFLIQSQPPPMTTDLPLHRLLKKSYEQLLSADYPETYWLNETHWADHPTTAVLSPQPLVGRKGRRKEDLTTPHKSGSARTEGYYKISGVDKMKYLRDTVTLTLGTENKEKEFQKQESKNKVQNMSRHARSESRRLQTLLGEDYGDVMKINRLKFRKKDLRFGKSFIHDWGLYASEKIQEGELIIEYVGEVIRPSMADIREKRYEKSGIGSSYLFRIDSDTIIDATKTGNMARFINHSCNVGGRSGWIDGCVDGLMDAWVDRWMREWIDGCVDG